MMETEQLIDPRLIAIRKASKTLKPAVLIKSWQRLCLLVAGIETSESCEPANVATLEREIYDRYHGNMARSPPIIGTVRRAMDDQLDMTAADLFDIKFPKDKLSYAQLTSDMPAHTLWRYFKELCTEVNGKINIVYKTYLDEDLSIPAGKNIFDVIEETLQHLWFQNEDLRKDRAIRRSDGKS